MGKLAGFKQPQVVATLVTAVLISTAVMVSPLFGPGRYQPFAAEEHKLLIDTHTGEVWQLVKSLGSSWSDWKLVTCEFGVEWVRPH